MSDIPLVNVPLDAAFAGELIIMLRVQLEAHKAQAAELKGKIATLERRLSALQAAYPDSGLGAVPQSPERQGKRISAEAMDAVVEKILMDSGPLGATDVAAKADAAVSSVYKALERLEKKGSVAHEGRKWTATPVIPNMNLEPTTT